MYNLKINTVVCDTRRGHAVLLGRNKRWEKKTKQTAEEKNGEKAPKITSHSPHRMVQGFYWSDSIMLLYLNHFFHLKYLRSVHVDSVASPPDPKALE
jgi:hypothetical protein